MKEGWRHDACNAVVETWGQSVGQGYRGQLRDRRLRLQPRRPTRKARNTCSMECDLRFGIGRSARKLGEEEHLHYCGRLACQPPCLCRQCLSDGTNREVGKTDDDRALCDDAVAWLLVEGVQRRLGSRAGVDRARPTSTRRTRRRNCDHDPTDGVAQKFGQICSKGPLWPTTGCRSI